MNTDAFTEAARAEAEEYAWDRNAGTTHEDSLDRDAFASGYEYGAFWARDHLAAQEPTDAEVRALGRGLNEAGWTCHEGGDNPGFYGECEDCRRVCDDLARAALSAARAARRDEENR